MSNRTLLSLLMLVLLVYVIVAFDLATKVKVGVTNMIYGSEMVEMKQFRVVVDLLPAQLEKGGLTRESLRRELSEMLVKGGLKSLTDEEWQRAPGKPLLGMLIQTTAREDGGYRYSVTLEVMKIDTESQAPQTEKFKTVWLSSAMGEGDLSGIRARSIREMELFLNAHASY